MTALMAESGPSFSDFAGGAGLLVGLLYFMYQWSWHLVSDDSIKNGKSRHLPAAGSMAVFLSLAGMTSSPHRLLFSQDMGCPLYTANFMLFLPFFVFSITGYYFDHKLVNHKGGSIFECSAERLTWFVCLTGIVMVILWNFGGCVQRVGS